MNPYGKKRSSFGVVLILVSIAFSSTAETVKEVPRRASLVVFPAFVSTPRNIRARYVNNPISSPSPLGAVKTKARPIGGMDDGGDQDETTKKNASLTPPISADINADNNETPLPSDNRRAFLNAALLLASSTTGANLLGALEASEMDGVLDGPLIEAEEQVLDQEEQVMEGMIREIDQLKYRLFRSPPSSK